jgi:hypothetical protein
MHEITPQVYEQQREARRGSANPEHIKIPFWEWMVNERCTAFSAWQKFSGVPLSRSKPGWCFDRVGMTDSTLSDGRKVFVGGEHEDFGVPDFYIYNDVILVLPDDSVQIFGYTVEAFPPTDFHSATLNEKAVILIGGLGYPGERQQSMTPVYKLETSMFQIEKMDTSGANPGWIFNHSATLDPGGRSITVRGGEIYMKPGLAGIRDNFDEYSLDLATGYWSNLTNRPWKQFQIRTVDHKRISTSQLDPLLPDVPYESVVSTELEGDVTGAAWRSRQIVVQEVSVRYVMNVDKVLLTIKGSLPKSLILFLTEDLRKKMMTLLDTECLVDEL